MQKEQDVQLFVSVSQIGMSSVLQARADVVGRAYMISRQSHIFHVIH